MNEDKKKYGIIDEEPLMVKESSGAALASAVPRMSIHRATMSELSDDMEVPTLQYSLDELNDRISEGIEQYQRGECYSQEQVHAFFELWKKRA